MKYGETNCMHKVTHAVETGCLKDFVCVFASLSSIFCPLHPGLAIHTLAPEVRLIPPPLLPLAPSFFGATGATRTRTETVKPSTIPGNVIGFAG